MKRFLTKSRFALAVECPTKLFYTGKSEYMDRQDEDSFLAALADGGYQVGQLARLMHPGGVLVDELEHERALARTQELLRADRVTVFEAALAFEDYFIRVDILRKDGNELDLIEVKAKSYSAAKDGTLRGRRGGITSDFKPYLLDLAFQRHVARLALRESSVRAFLMLVDKESVATVDGLNQAFRIRKEGGRTVIDVVGRLDAHALGTPILVTLNVDSQVDELLAGSLKTGPARTLPFSDAVEFFARAYKDDARIPPSPSKLCGECQFRADEWPTDGQPRSGFHECWASAFDWGPANFSGATVLDLWNCRRKDALIESGVLKADKVTLEDLEFDGAEPGPDGLTAKHRQWYVGHREWPGGGDFWFDRDFVRQAMARWRYPLHFIDFETSMAAIPFTKGKRPYQMTAFQFSHHEMREDGTVRHRDQWLLAEPGRDPNIAFVRALRDALSRDQGTVFRWAAHENSVLNQLRSELLASAEPVADRDDLVGFIESITNRNDVVGPRDMVDLCDLSGRYYFHPATKGSASLKKVLPAVMQSSTRLREIYGVPCYGPGISLNVREPIAWWQERNGVAVDPYLLLPPLFADFTAEEVAVLDESLPEELREGGAAMAAYARLQSEDLPDAARNAMQQGLYRYCELDTLAMVMVVQAWQGWI